MLTVGTHGQALSVGTPGCLRGIPASQAGGERALLIVKKGTCIQRLRTRHARWRNPFLLLSPFPVSRLLQSPVDLGLHWTPVPES